MHGGLLRFNFVHTFGLRGIVEGGLIRFNFVVVLWWCGAYLAGLRSGVVMVCGRSCASESLRK